MIYKNFITASILFVFSTLSATAQSTEREEVAFFLDSGGQIKIEVTGIPEDTQSRIIATIDECETAGEKPRDECIAAAAIEMAQVRLDAVTVEMTSLLTPLATEIDVSPADLIQEPVFCEYSPTTETKNECETWTRTVRIAAEALEQAKANEMLFEINPFMERQRVKLAKAETEFDEAILKLTDLFAEESEIQNPSIARFRQNPDNCNVISNETNKWGCITASHRIQAAALRVELYEVYITYYQMYFDLQRVTIDFRARENLTVNNIVNDPVKCGLISYAPKQQTCRDLAVQTAEVFAISESAFDASISYSNGPYRDAQIARNAVQAETLAAQAAVIRALETVVRENAGN